MTRIRRGSLPTDNFTIISNAWLRDEALPWGSRGLLAWMTSHTEDFVITEDVIVESGPSGRDAVRTMLHALEEAGYLRRERTPVVTGGSTVDYVLIDPRESENSTLPRIGKPDPRNDQEEGGLFPAPTRIGKPDPRSSVEDQKKTKTPSVSMRPKQATRVPDDYIPTKELRAWFADENLHLVLDVRVEHDKFMDYWRACPGARGRKQDWPATWRNWMRTAAERARRRPGTALAPVSGAPYRSATDAKIQQTAILAAKFRQMEEGQA